MRIGELARRAEVTARTVRYYESLGLIPAGEREGNGQHHYPEQTLERLRKIDQLKRLGLSLEEIQGVIDMEVQTHMNTLGFIGTGALGSPIAINLLESGYALSVYNRTPSKAAPVIERGGHLVLRPSDTVNAGGIVVSLVWDDAALESIVTAEGFLSGLAPGGVHISMSTVSPDTSQRMADLHRSTGSLMVDAPVFGRPEAAVQRQLWIPISGPAEARERVRPLLTAMGAQGVFDFGNAIGAASMVKLAGNFLISSAVRSLTEAVVVAQGQGVAPPGLIQMLTTTLFNAPIYQSYGKMLVDGNATFSRSLIALKDLGTFTALAGDKGPIAECLLAQAAVHASPRPQAGSSEISST